MSSQYRSTQLVAEMTRAANTTAYAVGDVINGSAATTPITLSNAALRKGCGGVVVSVMLISSVAAGTPLQADLYLFDSSFTIAADNAAFAPSDAQIKGLVAVVPIYHQVTVGDLTNANAPDTEEAPADHNLSVNGVLQVNDLQIAYKCASASETLYGVLVARNAYTPASAEVITLKLGITRD